MNPNTDLDIWVELVGEDYPNLSREQYRNMKNVAAMHYFFGDDNSGIWIEKNEKCPEPFLVLFEKFLVIKNLRSTNLNNEFEN